MADLLVAPAPVKLVTLGLGSCIGLVLFDQYAKVAGMAHIMLPDSRGSLGTEKIGKLIRKFSIPCKCLDMEQQNHA